MRDAPLTSAGPWWHAAGPVRSIHLRVSLVLSLVTVGCGGDDGATPVPDAGPSTPDAPPSACQPQGAIGQLIRRAGNPQMIAGGEPSGEGEIDLSIEDPDLHWDGEQWVAYWATTHASSATSADGVRLIRRATSPDRTTWTLDDEPALIQHTAAEGWESFAFGAPTVAFNPDAAPDRRYLLLYAAASAAFHPTHHAVPAYRIGAAFSADGKTFTRVPAAESPHGADGLVLSPAQIVAATSDGVITDPELVVVDGVYHLYFSSFSCTGASCEVPESRGVAHATSSDGVHWTVHEAPIRSLLRTSERTSGGEQPSVIYDPVRCKWELWLRHDTAEEVASQPIDLGNMAGLYHADSTDGRSWSINYAFARAFAWDATKPGERLGMRGGADVALRGNGRLLLYVGFDDEDVPDGFELPTRGGGAQPAVMTLNIATRDLP